MRRRGASRDAYFVTTSVATYSLGTGIRLTIG
jgi:hypothetical protein